MNRVVGGFYHSDEEIMLCTALFSETRIAA